MSDGHAEVPHGADGLWRWLVGGLVGGGILLGLLVGAYAIGHHRGSQSATPAGTQPAATAPATTTTPPPATTASPAPAGPVQVTPELVARGKTLYASDGCSACHSLSGAAGAGPALDGAAGRQVELADGSTVTADDAYLERAIVDPDAQIVKGYQAGMMAAAVSGLDLGTRPDDVRALVAYLKSQSAG